jgi:hypothetical protein
VGRTAAVILLCGCAAVVGLAACAHDRVSSGSTTGTTQVIPVQSNTPQTPIDTTIGKSVTTPQGNVITVYQFQSPVAYGAAGTVIAAAEVGVCASRTTVVTRAGGVVVRAGVSPRFFSVGFTDGTLAEAIVPGVKRPAIVDGFLSAGQCVRGWVTFRAPEQQHAKYVLLRSLSAVRWQIPAGTST